MLAFLQTNTPIVIFNQIVVTLLTVCFLYQVDLLCHRRSSWRGRASQGQKTPPLCLLYCGA